MFKPVKFREANYFVPASKSDKGGGTLFHFYQDPKSHIKVSCVEITDKDIEEIKKSRKIYLITNTEKFVPFTIQAKSPFSLPSAGKRLQDNERKLRINAKEEGKD